ncbi:hypothetical protein B5S25_19245 [Paenibacillus larvae subsp. pulvifaciens]|nr:hypothetical protein B5S25_19245 [Paenibacillus larvae subsp. pulvifaciens]
MRYYNERRIHSSIHDLSPYEFYDKNQKQLISIIKKDAHHQKR